MSLRRSTGQIQYGLAARQYRYENALTNGCFRVWQRGETITAATTFPNTDDNYCADQWCFLADGADRADLSREQTTVPDGFESAFKFEGASLTAGPNSEKFGILQVIESQNCAHLIDGGNGIVNLSFYACTEALEVENIRAVVLAWDGVAGGVDTVTSDVVAVWAAEGTNPTWAANWTEENTPADHALTNAYQRFTITDIAIDTADTTNIGVFFWVDDKDVAAGDSFYVAGVQLERAYVGRGVSDFVHRPIGDELALCQRYFTKTFLQGTAPVTNPASVLGCLTGVGDWSDNVAGQQSGLFEMEWRFKQTMFAAPTVVQYNPNNASNDARNVTDGSQVTVTTAHIGDDGCGFYTITVLDVNLGDLIALHATAEAVL